MKILFLCVANSARSQMAEGLARKIFDDKAEIFSAGSSPSFVHTVAIEVMNELNIDISHQSSKSISTIDLDSMDMIITLCADEVCPYVSGHVQKYHWPMPDPAKSGRNKLEQLALFRQIRDDLKERITRLKIAFVKRA